MHGNIFLDVSANFGSSFLGNETSKSTDVNVFSLANVSFTSLNMVSSVTSTSTLEYLFFQIFG